MVDFFPIMRCVNYLPYSLLFLTACRHIPTWAPFSAFKVKALATRTAVEAMMRIPYEQVVADMVSARAYMHACGAGIHTSAPPLQKSGTAVPSYTSTLLEAHCGPAGVLSPEDEEDIRGSAGTLFAGALVPTRIQRVRADQFNFIAAEDTVGSSSSENGHGALTPADNCIATHADVDHVVASGRDAACPARNRRSYWPHAPTHTRRPCRASVSRMPT